MLTVSQDWIEAFNQDLVPETFVEIEMDMLNLSQDSATLSAPNVSPIGVTDGSDLLNKIPSVDAEKYAMLDFNWWVLDGSAEIIDDIRTYQADHYIKNNASTQGDTIILTFDRVISDVVPGFTITWDNVFGGYATEFRLLVYRDSTLVERKQVQNQDYMTYVQMVSSNFNKVRIEVLSWSKPNQRVRISGFCLGVKLSFGKDQLISYTYEQTGDPICSEMTICTSRFTLDNSDGRWDLLNRTGLSQFLTEQQKIKIKYGVDINGTTEWVQAALLHLSEWSIPSNGIEASFVARDELAFSENHSWSRTMISGTIKSEVSIYDSVKLDVNGDEPVGSYLPGTVVNIYEYGADYAAVGDSEPTHLAYLTDRGWIAASAVESESYLTAMDAIVNCLSDMMGGTVTFVIGDLASVVQIPLFVEDTICTEMVQLSANACGYSVWFDANGLLHVDDVSDVDSGYSIPLDWSYFYPEIELAKPLRTVEVVQHYPYDTEYTEAVVVTANNVGDSIVIDNPFVLTLESSAAELLANKQRKMWQERTILSGDFRADPRLELFDVISVETKYSVITPILITSIKYTYNGAFRGSYVGRKISRS